MVAALSKVGVDVGGCSVDDEQLSTLYRKNTNPSKAQKQNNQILADEIEDIEARNGRLRVLRKLPNKRPPANFTLQIPPLQREPARDGPVNRAVGTQDMRDDDAHPTQEEEAANILKKWCKTDPFGDADDSTAPMAEVTGVNIGSRTSGTRSPQSSQPQSPHTRNSLSLGILPRAGVNSQPGSPKTGTRSPQSSRSQSPHTRKTLDSCSSSPRAGVNSQPGSPKNLTFLHAASGSSSDEEDNLLGPILDHRLQPRDKISRRVSKTRRASTFKTAGRSQKQKLLRILSEAQPIRDDSDSDNKHPAVHSRNPRRKSNALQTAPSDPENTSEDDNLTATASQGRGRGRGRGRAQGSGSVQTDRANVAAPQSLKSSRVKITPRLGNQLQLRVSSPKKSAPPSRHVALQSTSQRKKKIVMDSDEEHHPDNPRDDDWTPDPNMEASDDNDKDMHQQSSHEREQVSSKSKKSNRPTTLNQTNRLDSTRDLSGDTSNTRRKGKGRAINQDMISDENKEDLLAKELEDNIMNRWNDNNLLGDESPAAGPESPLQTGLSDLADDLPPSAEFASHTRQELNILRKHVSVVSANTSTNSADIRRMNAKMDMLFDLVKRALSKDKPRSEDNRGSQIAGSPCARTTPQRRYIGKLVRVLLGWKPDHVDIPHGASPAEKRNWNTHLTMQGLLANGPSNLQDSDNTTFTSGLADQDESPGTIKIIRDTLYQAGVAKYRPEWSEPMGLANNAHLCRVATVIFIKLVREGRSQFVMARPNLWTLTQVVQACCSDDETNSEADQHEDRKMCKIWRLPWRNPQLEKIFDDIDAARERQNPAKGSPGTQPRVRQHNANYPVSKRGPPKGLNVDCYCPVWLDAVVGRRELLKVVEQPILAAVKKNLARCIALNI
ncbi:uncharacterized protein MELLADRAFT_102618 [Melampsora larici-populina 98AG31]|uniref:Uncharacterized protein n=1 Tax=Melampsora larici-populina (strain 98AG31 / pathotype 3-4-7) TaxID=747676 RepID=F4R8U7_MELLP|nr:uncharacterized protein MELLADRAFT_102618 [Melampsora larici-populina 98AG31]EGG11265.1 hypothetical protein MELLADRAFT_102618 [Melampsora larici-populina 98AG31]